MFRRTNLCGVGDAVVMKSELAMFRRYKPHILELGVILGAYLVYLLIRGLGVADIESLGTSNAEKIVSLEKNMGIFWEPGWQKWALENAHPLVLVLNWVYIFTYWPIIFLSGLLFYCRERLIYYQYRNVILVGFVIAIVMFTVFPLSPPFSEAGGLVNTIQELGPTFYGGPSMARFYNVYAAMPSLHFTWTAVLGVLLVRRTSGLWKSLGVAYPAVTFFAITITGNHFIVDAIAGGLLAGLSLGLVEWWTRRRRVI